MVELEVTTVATKPFDGQKPGTSGLRKAVKVFQQQHYTENFIECILQCTGAKDKTLVVGGDGRYFGTDCVDIIAKISAAFGVRKLIVGQNSILSTPAVSAIIRERAVLGGIVLTASHNPGGPDADFGIKFNCSNGGPAPDAVTTDIHNMTTTLASYKTCPGLQCDVTKLGVTDYQVAGVGPFTIEVVDSVECYVALMKQIFDFALLKNFLSSFPVLLDCMNGVTGPYVERIFLQELGISADCLRGSKPLLDFGGLHPDPNLTYAKPLVDTMKGSDKFQLGAAFDGDGDRNMILGARGFFVTPCDSVAVIADNTQHIPYFAKHGGVKGLARSMPTSCAIDRVGKAKGLTVYEVPTGWKYFGNLMDAGKLSICGEESFGTGSDHVREKDGVWAVLAWLSILAASKSTVPAILSAHWKTYGRNYFTRYDYENCASAPCNEMVTGLRAQLPALAGSKHEESGKSYTVAIADDFAYTDPIDGSHASQQGIRLVMEDGSRVIYRLSGTGSSGATVRLYVESYEKYADGQEELYLQDSQVVLKPLLTIALGIAKLTQFTGRDAPTVIT